MEYFDLYSVDRVPLGRKIPRGVPLPPETYHIVVQVMTVNTKGEVLLTQRVPEKTSGGRWECSGGCAVSGETSRGAAVRELFEETGLKVKPEEIIPEWSFVNDSMLRDFYILNMDAPLEKLKLQQEEIDAAKWVSFERLEEMSAQGQTTRAITKWLEVRRRELRSYIESVVVRYGENREPYAENDMYNNDFNSFGRKSMGGFFTGNSERHSVGDTYTRRSAASESGRSEGNFG